MKIAVSIDSACDMPKEVIAENNISTIAYYVTMGENEYRDGVNVSGEEIFNHVKEEKTLPKTGAPSAEEFKEYFSNILKDNDVVIHFSLSNEMSSACANARLGAEGLNVRVIDSMNLSSGIAVLVLSCIEKIKQGKDVDTIVKEVEDERSKVQASFLVDTLSYLHKGGRCSSIALLSSKILMIKPKISVINGIMSVTKKYMGKIGACLKKYVDDVLASSNPDTTVAFCTHSGKMDISSEICDKLRNFGFKKVYDCVASSTISSHCGPNTLGILFMNK